MRKVNLSGRTYRTKVKRTMATRQMTERNGILTLKTFSILSKKLENDPKNC